MLDWLSCRNSSVPPTFVINIVVALTGATYLGGISWYDRFLLGKLRHLSRSCAAALLLCAAPCLQQTFPDQFGVSDKIFSICSLAVGFQQRFNQQLTNYDNEPCLLARRLLRTCCTHV